MYKKLLSGVLATLLTAPCSAYVYNHKTFLLPRSVTSNKPVETSIWYPHITNDVGNKCGSTLQASFFYTSSENGGDIGKYFGVGNGNQILVKNSTQVSSNFTNKFIDFPAESILHDPTSPISTFDGTITLNPKQLIYGGMLGYFQDLRSITSGLAFKLLVPFAYVRTDPEIAVTGATTQVGTVKISDYFRGKVTQTEPDRLQDPLKKGIIAGRRHKTLFSDILATLQYNFLEGGDHYVTVGGGLSIPTGNKSKSNSFFEPMVGSGGHIGLMVSADAGSRLWSDDDCSLELIVQTLYTYFFRDNQTRIPGLLSQDGHQIPWGHYQLAGQVGKQGVFPLANVLAQKVRVRLGNQIEVLTALALSIYECSLTAGVNIYGRQDERVMIINFEENTYGLTSPSYNTTADFTANDVLVGETLITNEMLDPRAAATPAQMTVKVYGSFGYAARNVPVPVLFGGGASYEFVGNNDALGGVGIWLTAGISF